MKTTRSILALSLGLLGLAASHASAQTVINSVPYTINSSGKYVLGTNLSSASTTQAAITISVANVVLDLNQYFVAGPGNTAAAFSAATSVINVGNVANVTIRNGTVAGNAIGIYFTASTAGTTSKNYLVEDVTLTRCYYDAIYYTAAAPGSVIRSCSFSSLGNSTNTANTSPSAIFTEGGIRIEANNINGVTPTGTGTSYGVNGLSTDFAINNTFANCTTGMIYVGKYIGNLTNSVTTNFSGGTAVGDNN